jgi:hypothetical protein
MTEQELNDVGKEPYLALLRLIKMLMVAKDGHSKFALRFPANFGVNSKKKTLRALFSLENDPAILTIPGRKIAEIEGLKLHESISLAIKDLVLDEFIHPINPVGASMPFCLSPNKDRAHHDILIAPRMNVEDINQYITKVLARENKESRDASDGRAKKEVQLAEVTRDEKVEIVIDEESGIYRKDDQKKKYRIKGARKEYVFAIYKNKGQTMQQLMKLHDQDDTVVSAGVSGINDNVRKILLGGEGADLIEHQPTPGKYMLNKENFSFVGPHHIE